MFGVMKGAPRAMYCGTCKTMGARYGHQARMLLNHDAVFLAELLASVAPPMMDGTAYQSFNCLRLPSAPDIPITLDYAAAAAVVLAHFCVDDHVRDSPGVCWRAVRRFLSPAYRKAEAQLRRWGFPMDELIRVLESQAAREAEAKTISSVAEPTAVASALFFAHGAKLAGRSGMSASFYQTGYVFGYLIYLLDAYEDIARDAASGNFNPLRQFPDINGRLEVLALLRDFESKLPPEFASRARVRVEERLGIRPRVLHGRCASTVSERWNSALLFARQMRERERGGLVKGTVVLATATAAAFLIPHHVRGAESWRHLMGLGLNVMALGAMFASVPGPPTPTGTEKSGSGCFSSCCSVDWCAEGCCDGCCDSCDCG